MKTEYHSTTKTILVPVIVTYNEQTHELLAYERVEVENIVSALNNQKSKIEELSKD